MMAEKHRLQSSGSESDDGSNGSPVPSPKRHALDVPGHVAEHTDEQQPEEKAEHGSYAASGEHANVQATDTLISSSFRAPLEALACGTPVPAFANVVPLAVAMETRSRYDGPVLDIRDAPPSDIPRVMKVQQMSPSYFTNMDITRLQLKVRRATGKSEVPCYVSLTVPSSEMGRQSAFIINTGFLVHRFSRLYPFGDRFVDYVNDVSTNPKYLRDKLGELQYKTTASGECWHTPSVKHPELEESFVEMREYMEALVLHVKRLIINNDILCDLFKPFWLAKMKAHWLTWSAAMREAFKDGQYPPDVHTKMMESDGVRFSDERVFAFALRVPQDPNDDWLVSPLSTKVSTDRNGVERTYTGLDVRGRVFTRLFSDGAVRDTQTTRLGLTKDPLIAAALRHSHDNVKGYEFNSLPLMCYPKWSTCITDPHACREALRMGVVTTRDGKESPPAVVLSMALEVGLVMTSKSLAEGRMRLELSPVSVWRLCTYSPSSRLLRTVENALASIDGPSSASTDEKPAHAERSRGEEQESA